MVFHPVSSCQWTCHPTLCLAHCKINKNISSIFCDHPWASTLLEQNTKLILSRRNWLPRLCWQWLPGSLPLMPWTPAFSSQWRWNPDFTWHVMTHDLKLRFFQPNWEGRAWPWSTSCPCSARWHLLSSYTRYVFDPSRTLLFIFVLAECCFWRSTFYPNSSGLFPGIHTR